MSWSYTSFTPPSTIDISLATSFNEMVDAINERINAQASSSTVGLVSIGDDMQLRALGTLGDFGGAGCQNNFLNMQNVLEKLCITFADQDLLSGLVGTGSLTQAFNFTLATWIKASGLNGDGSVAGNEYRRVTACNSDGSPIFGQFGFCQYGDVIGSWLYEDIEKGIASLKYMGLFSGSPNAGFSPSWGPDHSGFLYLRAGYDSDGTSIANAGYTGDGGSNKGYPAETDEGWPDAIAHDTWPMNTYAFDPPYIGAYAQLYFYGEDPGFLGYNFQVSSSRNNALFFPITTSNDITYDVSSVYALVMSFSPDSSNTSSLQIHYDPFDDIVSGATENTVFNITSIPSSLTGLDNSASSPMVWDLDSAHTDPLMMVTYSPTVPPGGNYTMQYGYHIDQSIVVLQPHFTKG